MKPLPTNRRFQDYTDRLEYLCEGARYEALRLSTLPFSSSREGELLRGESFVAEVGGGESLRFIRVEPSSYVDGLDEETRERIIRVPNRNNDVARWKGQLEVHRRNRVEVPYPSYMSETLVSNAMFAAFVGQTRYRTVVSRFATGWYVDGNAQWREGVSNDWQQQFYPMSEPDRPVVLVSWFDAMSFAQWLSRKTGVCFRLPTKEEWTLAARPEAMKDRVCAFPWGNDLEGIEGRMNFGTRELADYMWIHEQFADGHAYSSPVRAYPPTERGLYDMLGNVWVWNWTNQAKYDARSQGDRVARPDTLAELGADRNEHLTMQGGCFLARLSHANLFSKMSHPAMEGAHDIGFRLVAVGREHSGIPGRAE